MRTNKSELIQKLKQIEGISQEERSYLIDLVNTKKKYGLVWEDKSEEVEELLRSQLPVFREVVERRILSRTGIAGTQKSADPEVEPKVATLFPELDKPENQVNKPIKPNQASATVAPNHILIEGDNLHALTALSYTHEGKIDAMYFDPPYNTGAKDWRYNNDFVVKEDSFRHSKWISMMSKRLKIAKKLLKDDGIICVTIDDYEMPRLTMLMEEIFGEENHLGTLVIRINPSGRSTVKGVSITHEYGLFFGKSENANVGRLPRNEKQTQRYDVSDDKSAYEWVNFRKHGGMRKESPSMYYPIYITEDSIRIPDLEWSDELKEWIPLDNPTNNEVVVFPIDDKGQDRRWKWGLDRIRNSPNEFCVKKDRSGNLAVYVKARMINDSVLPLTWWDKKEYSATAYGTNLIKDIFGELQVFSYPKALYAVVDCIRVLTNKNDALILDIFAGSGTTLHATMQLNAEDGGNRQCILVTNNENNICEEVTYERNRRVIQGYTNSKGEWVKGLTNNNLRYYKCDFVPSLKDEPNKRMLTQASTDLLCIKEDCYTELTESAGFNPVQCRIFTNDRGKYLMVIFHCRKQFEVYGQLIDFIKSLGNLKEPVKLYAFSPEKETMMEDFAEVADKIEAVPLPEAIYNAYRATFKTLKLDRSSENLNEASANSSTQNTLSDENELSDPNQDPE